MIQIIIVIGGAIGEKVATIGFVIGAILGFIEAISSATSFWGSVGYTAFGAFGGTIIGGLFAAVLPWAIGAGILFLILKACGVG